MASLSSWWSYATGNEFNSRGEIDNCGVVQGYYPFAGQCVSLIQGYMKYNGCTVCPRGNAIDWWKNFNSNGLSQYFTKQSSPQNGDVVVTNADPNYGHIGIYKDGQLLQQNYAQYPYARFLPLSVSGSPYGYLRPKFLSSYSDSQLINEHAYATLKFDVQKRRDTPTGLAVETLKAGRKLEYTQKWVGDGHRYISWVEHQADGHSYRYFVAVNGNEQGTEPWATFEPLEQKVDLTEEHGWAKAKVDQINIRKGSVDGQSVGLVNNGDVIEYQYKCVTDSHRYIVKKNDGEMLYIACSPTPNRSTEWFDFYAENPVKTNDSTNKDDKPSDKPNDKPDKGTIDMSNVKHWGVDISEHNAKDLDLTQWDFVIIRASWGTNTDKYFRYFVEVCEKNKIPFGVYHYSYAIDKESSDAETQYFLDTIKGLNPPLGVWFDMEDADGYKKKKGVLDKEHVLEFTKNFCSKVKAEGYYTGIYASTWWFDNWLNEELDDYDKWVAEWGANDGYYHSDTSNRGTIHQYTSIDTKTGTNIDKNAMYVDFDHYKVDKPSDKPNDDKPSNKPNDDKPSDSNDNGELNNTLKETNGLLKTIIEVIKKIFNLK